MPQKRDFVITSNWKMHKTVAEALAFVENLAPHVRASQARIYIAPPFTAIPAMAAKIKEKNFPFKVGGQNMHDAAAGAFTGEIAAAMLKEAGASFVLLGHSERRQFFHEEDAFINRKVLRALQEGLLPVLCVGESGAERERGEMEAVVQRQLVEGLKGVVDITQVMVAYEPVWAIGTGKVAGPAEASAAHKFCRQVLGQKWGAEAAAKVIIQYGGSVRPENAKNLATAEDIDGFLIGGASLSVESLSQIINQV